MNLTLSAIVPTKDRPADLEAVVRSLLGQTSAPRQTVIVDQSASKESEERIKRLYQHLPADARDRVRLDYLHDRSISGLTDARNHGLELVDADVCLFLDDDVVLEPDFVQELLAAYAAHPEATGISGVVTNYPRPDFVTRAWSSIFLRGIFHDDRQPVYWNADRLRQSRPVRVSRLGGGLMSFRMSAIRGVRFNDTLQGLSPGEDVDFCARLGPKAELFISPRARLVHNHSPSGRERGYWVRRHARGLFILYANNWRHGLRNRLAFAWLNVGYALIVTLGSMRRGSLEPWRALAAARRDARELERRARLLRRPA